LSQVYQKKTPVEHVLLRPDTYVGSTERTEQEVWLMDKQSRRMRRRKISYVPGLFKLFDEILVNASDNRQRDSKMSEIRVEIDVARNVISVRNDGSGVPVAKHDGEDVMIPTMVFGQLLTGSNFDDREAKVTGGRNGFGAKLTNIFSSRFSVETRDSKRGLEFAQTWRDNMSVAEEPVIRAIDGRSGALDFTQVTFEPDLRKFAMASMADDDIVELMERRVFDMAACNSGLRVYLNGTLLPCASFDEYVSLFAGDAAASATTASALSASSEVVYFSPPGAQSRWKVAVGLSDSGQFENVSFVNSIATTRGGTHVSDFVDALTKKLAERIGRKNRGGVAILPAHVRNHLFVFMNALVENPAFDSQTKETLMTKPRFFGSRCVPTDALVRDILARTRLEERVLSWAAFKQQEELSEAGGGSGPRKSRIVGIPKLDDANQAGTARSTECTLILTEGDSAKALAISGLSVIGRDFYGVFPLKGKLLNVRDASHEQLLRNKEMEEIQRIVGLSIGADYGDDAAFGQLRYGRVMIMTDQDHDGSHIKGLLINFFHHFWPALLERDDFLCEFVTPIVKARRGRGKNAEERHFYTLPEYEQWRADQEDALQVAVDDGGESEEGDVVDDAAKTAKTLGQKWTIKYYKGLGTNTAQEAKQYFGNLERHVIDFRWREGDDARIELAFDRRFSDKRKDWLMALEGESSSGRHRHVDHSQPTLTYGDFIDNELILFSHADNVRSIPSVVDGLKPGQRKVLYGCFKRRLNAEVKVAQLAGFISEHTGYHHGEQSLHSTITNMAQDFVGANNVPLLEPIGQFGTRLQGGKDAASPRYIYTRLSPAARLLFPEADDDVLDYMDDDGFPIEPRHYVPVVPLVLINGTEGLGTGWSTFLPCFNPLEVLENTARFVDNKPLRPMTPYYRGFRGAIEPLDGASRFDTLGRVTRLGKQRVRIDELPVRRWTIQYKEHLETDMKARRGRLVQSFTEHHSDTSVDFDVRLTPRGRDLLDELEAKHGADQFSVAAARLFKLNKSLSVNNVHLFDANSRIKRYSDARDIIEDFGPIRLDAYERRKAHQLERMRADHARLANRVRFTGAVVEQRLPIMNRARQSIVDDLVAAEFEPESPAKPRDFGYLLNTSVHDFTRERLAKLGTDERRLATDIEALESTTPAQLWHTDLDRLRVFLKRLFANDKKQSKQDKKDGGK
jgi:DNA topoisomerase II